MENDLSIRYLKAKRRLFDIAYGDLNERQREAVFTANGTMLVLAGAGSGKTTVLVRRIVFLAKYGNAYYSDFVPAEVGEADVRRLERMASEAKKPTPETRAQLEAQLAEFSSSPCPPWQLLAITFTNKAANEIKNRLALAMADNNASGEIWAGTFHSICMRILRRYGHLVGYREGFTVYDTDDSKKAVAAAMKDLNIDEKTMPVKSVMSEIERAKEQLMSAQDFAREYADGDYRRRQMGKIYQRYEQLLKSSNAVDFDDIIMQTVILLRENDEVREYYQNKFRYVSVDEFQDTNSAQFELTALLGGGSKNIMVVGDDDQSIYKFRGAIIENILGFDKKYKDTKIIKLEQNYRSTGIILDAANSVISQNFNRKGKTLWTDKKGGSKIKLKKCEDQTAEARYICDEVTRLHDSGDFGFRDCAILYRTKAQSNIIERTFAKAGVPCRMLGGIRFNDLKEIRDIVAYLQIIVNPADSERLKRIINEPRRGIGAQTVSAVFKIAQEEGVTPLKIMCDADKYVALSRSASKLKLFAQMIEDLRITLKSGIALDAFVNLVLDRSGYRHMLVVKGAEEENRLENLEEFISSVLEYEEETDEPSLIGFLEENALVADVDKYDEDADAVVMMTIHSAKGLEFPVVFLPGMEDGLFPGIQNLVGDPQELEEERRLAYVAITRAEKLLYLSHAENRMLYGRTNFNPLSRFVKEIPAELIKEEKGYLDYGYTSDIRPKSYIGHARESEKSEAAKADSALKKPRTLPTLAEGDRVWHFSFGEGEILSVKNMTADVLYEVAFDNVGTKKLMGSYARLKKIDW